ncbi:MAG: DUF2165 domain-containing protein [Gammaproteobacteria bacterium]|nr:DUF2165 domain-containing protein [Gammaproteobacteria bacterium]
MNNILDYQINFAAVRHVMLMDSVFPGNNSMWRAVEAPWLHHLAYWLIIATEVAIALLGFWGASDLWRARRDAAQFNRRKTKAVLALTLGILLWFGGFLVVAGEWFLMWQSQDWNAQQPAFFFAASFLLILILLVREDRDDRSTSPP